MPEDQAPKTAETIIGDSRLMFALAHDVRTHLRTVLINLQLIQRGGAAALPADDQRMLQEAVAAGGEINGLMNAMVAYCDASAGDGEMGLALLLRGLLIEWKGALANAGAEVELSNDADPSVPLALANVVKELLTNACKFRDAERPLRIRIATRITSDKTLQIAVSDNGIGVPAAYLQKIFEPSHRVHSRDPFPGPGLGLATCRRIADAWGGAIAAESGERGLRVRLTVPIGNS